jgi:hypothetical protein
MPSLSLVVVRMVTDFLGLDFSSDLASLIASDSPSFFTTLGTNVRRTEFEGWDVYTIAPSSLPRHVADNVDEARNEVEDWRPSSR